MFTFLLKKFIKSNDFKKKENRDKAIKLTGILGFIINIFLFIIKLVIGIFINSISVISDSLNNLADCLTNVVTVVGMTISEKPADKEHPYGHGRTEYIVTMLIGTFIVVVGVQSLISSVKVLLSPEEILFSSYTFIILVISILFKIYMYVYNKKAANLLDSKLNQGIAKDSLNDSIATILVLISIFVYQISNYNIDGFVGTLISILVIKTGLELILDMGKVLLGQQISDKKLQTMRKIILDGKYIIGVHKIEIHEYGKGQLYGSCHVEAPANIDVFTMHAIVHEIENKVFEKTNIKLNIHIDPSYLLEEDNFNRIKNVSVLDDIDLDD